MEAPHSPVDVNEGKAKHICHPRAAWHDFLFNALELTLVFTTLPRVEADLSPDDLHLHLKPAAPRPATIT